jgi:Holliday junction resolvase RusA-like endonuclease
LKVKPTFTFTIPGNPHNIIRYKNLSHSVRDKYQDARSHSHVSITSQHPTEQLISGPISIACTFVFDFQQAKQWSPKKINYHNKFPTLPSLYGFIEGVMKGLLFDNEVLVAQLQMTKIYGESPRTDITITKL